MLFLRHMILLICILGLISNTAYGYGQGEIHIKSSLTSQKAKTKYHVEITQNDEEKMKGLMFRSHMKADHGMYFSHEGSVICKYWMKNTLIPLDVLFLDQDGKIIHISLNTTPKDLTSFGPDAVCYGVVELNAGQVEKHHIHVGDYAILDS